MKRYLDRTIAVVTLFATAACTEGVATAVDQLAAGELLSSQSFTYDELATSETMDVSRLVVPVSAFDHVAGKSKQVIEYAEGRVMLVEMTFMGRRPVHIKSYIGGELLQQMTIQWKLADKLWQVDGMSLLVYETERILAPT